MWVCLVLTSVAWAVVPERGVSTGSVAVDPGAGVAEGESIRYTLDGSTPDATNGTLAAGALAFRGTTVLRTRRFDAAGQVLGEVTTRTYALANAEAGRR